MINHNREDLADERICRLRSVVCFDLALQSIVRSGGARSSLQDGSTVEWVACQLRTAGDDVEVEKEKQSLHKNCRPGENNVTLLGR